MQLFPLQETALRTRAPHAVFDKNVPSGAKIILGVFGVYLY